MADPKLGIFWFYDGEIIFSHAVCLVDGLHYGDAVTGVKDHADYWEELERKGKLDVLDESLREEYFFHSTGQGCLSFRFRSIFLFTMGTILQGRI